MFLVKRGSNAGIEPIVFHVYHQRNASSSKGILHHSRHHYCLYYHYKECQQNSHFRYQSWWVGRVWEFYIVNSSPFLSLTKLGHFALIFTMKCVLTLSTHLSLPELLAVKLLFRKSGPAQFRADPWKIT